MAIAASLRLRIFKNVFARYGVALLATAAALAARRGLTPFLGDYVPFVTLFPAIAFSAWYCGIGPSILSVLISLAGAQYWFATPFHSLRPGNTTQFVGILAFLATCAIIVAMGNANRKNVETAQNAHEELEERVRQRTSELKTANDSLRELSSRLMQLQDDERRRLARELHDSVGQMLVGLTMNLSAARGDLERLAKTMSALTDSEALVQELSREVRTISHLLHPPLLDEAGLHSALRWYVDGFAERSQIEVHLDFPDNFGRLPRDLETAIFRIVQECLTNIHRHSGSPVAHIRITRSESQVAIRVQDRGKGIPEEKLDAMSAMGMPGVGIRGMRERLRQLGGVVEIQSGGEGKGTIVLARLPVSANSTSTAAA
jgi:signal transduction histidine kinase